MTADQERDEARFNAAIGVSDEDVRRTGERYFGECAGDYSLALWRSIWEDGKAYGLELREAEGEG